MQNDYLKLSEIAGKGRYHGKDYKDKNGHWVLIYDAEFWEETGKRESDFPVFAHVDMRKDGWTPDPKALYKAREHWVRTIEPFRVVTPKEEREKIKQRQKDIYREIVNEFLESYKTEFLEGLKNAPDENGFLEIKLEHWRNYKFSSEVVCGYRNFDKIVPRSIEEKFPIMKGKPNNYQPKEEARYLFFKWLEKYQLSNEATPPPPTSTGTNEKRKTGRTKDPETQKRNFDIYNAYVKHIRAERLPEKDALDMVYKSFKRKFTGEPKNIKDQIRRIIKATQSDTN